MVEGVVMKRREDKRVRRICAKYDSLEIVEPKTFLSYTPNHT